MDKALGGGNLDYLRNQATLVELSIMNDELLTVRKELDEEVRKLHGK